MFSIFCQKPLLNYHLLSLVFWGRLSCYRLSSNKIFKCKENVGHIDFQDSSISCSFSSFLSCFFSKGF